MCVHTDCAHISSRTSLAYICQYQEYYTCTPMPGTYMEIHVHSTLAMKEVGRKERQPRQTRHITPRPDKQDIQDIDFTNHTKIGQTNSHKYNMQHQGRRYRGGQGGSGTPTFHSEGAEPPTFATQIHIGQVGLSPLSRSFSVYTERLSCTFTYLCTCALLQHNHFASPYY